MFNLQNKELIETRNQEYRSLLEKHETSQNEAAKTSERVLKQKELKDESKAFRAKENLSIDLNKEFQSDIEDFDVIQSYETVEFGARSLTDSKLENESKESDSIVEIDTEKASDSIDLNENSSLTPKSFQVIY